MKTIRLSLLVSYTLLVFPMTAISQWSNDPAVNNIICNLSGEQAIPKIANCPDGNIYIGYFSNESGNYDVRLQKLDASGNILWVANGILVSNNPQNTWLTDWDMTCDGTNNAILVFNDIRNGGNTNVVAYKITPDGTFSWGANGIALSNSTAFNAAPKVVVTAVGNTVVAWHTDNVTILQKISSDGTLQWGNNGITISGTPRISWPQLLPVGTDDVILKYFEDTGSILYPTRHVLAQRYNGSGNAVWTAATTISSAGGISAWTQIFPFINDGSDGFYIAWHDDRNNDQRASSFVQHVNSSGGVVFTANGVEVSSLSSMNHYYPQLALPPTSSDIFIYWNEMNYNQDQWGLYGQKVSSSGSLLWGNTGKVFIAISSTDVYPMGARKSQTDMVLFYEQYFDGINTSIKAMRINTSGDFVWTPSSVTMCSYNSQKVHAVVNEFASNEWVSSWEDNRSGNADIYAQNILLDGSLGPPAMGTISGLITLNGGSGIITDVVVQAGTTTTHPDVNGLYSMQVYPGTYVVSATLNGYYPASESGVVVTSNQTTTVNLVLNPILAGNIDGIVTLVGGGGLVNLALVTAGSTSIHPDASGHYNMVVSPGTYDVIGTLNGYFPDTVFGINVVNGQTVYNVNLTLEAAPTTGFIQGTVTLNGGTGVVTDAVVSAGGYTTNPDATGFYSLEVPAGNYDVSASLTGYITQTFLGIQVVVNQITPNINFTLVPDQGAGNVQGNVTLTGGTADVTLTSVYSGSYATHPDATGFYSLQLPQGTYNITAENPYTTSQTINNVQVQSGQITPGIDFLLTVVRADLVCKALDNLGNYLNQVNVVIDGPEGPYNGIILQDSLLFPHVPYGTYNGTATFSGEQVQSDTVIDASNHHLVFHFLYSGIKPQNNLTNLIIVPNPTDLEGIIRFDLAATQPITFYLSDNQGKFIRLRENQTLESGRHNIALKELLKDVTLTDGIYYLSIFGNGSFSTVKIVLHIRR